MSEVFKSRDGVETVETKEKTAIDMIVEMMNDKKVQHLVLGMVIAAGKDDLEGRFSSKTVETLKKASDVFIELAQIDLTEIKEEQH